MKRINTHTELENGNERAKEEVKRKQKADDNNNNNKINDIGTFE